MPAATIRFNNALSCHALLRWAAERDVELHFIAIGKSIQTGNVESMNGKICDDLFNLHQFTTTFWKAHYNEV